MATLRQFSLFDMLHYNNVNLDVMTETFNSYFYAKYLIKWPEYCVSLWNSVSYIQAYCSYGLIQCWARLKGTSRRRSGMGM
jgi:N-terminal acetyltransferase B complex catalytic subunit